MSNRNQPSRLMDVYRSRCAQFCNDLRMEAPPGECIVLKAARDEHGEYLRDKHGNVIPERK